MAKRNTSLRLPDDLRVGLAEAAERQGTSISALLERHAHEGLAGDAHPGIVTKPGPSGRRAALAGGPDVWEVIATLQATSGSEVERVRTVADQLGLHPRQVAIALGYAAEHPEEVSQRIADNERALQQAERAAAARAQLLDTA